jgi:hypothetical protein
VLPTLRLSVSFALTVALEILLAAPLGQSAQAPAAALC